MRMLCGLLLLFALAAPAAARDFVVTVRDPAGQPVQNAVVTLNTPGAPPPASRLAGPFAVAQQGLQFHPFVLVAPVGASVQFPNKDKVRHHVYSFSGAKTFQLKLYGRDETRSVVFDKAGVVALGCNIHDQMLAFIYVADTPYAAKTDAAGRAVLDDVPAGAARLTVWHPFAKAKDGRLVSQVGVPAAGGAQSVSLDVRPAPASMQMH